MSPGLTPITIRDSVDPKRIVMRYFPQQRFAELFTTSRVWFSNLEELKDDPLEGTLPSKAHSQRLKRDQDLKAQFAHVVPQDQFDSMTARDLQSGRKFSAVNCWYMDHRESLAMWSKYGKNGAAIMSTVAHIAHAFNRRSPTDDIPQVGPVRYINFDSDDSVAMHTSHDAFGRAFLKDQRWADEKELRIANLNLEMHPKGLLYPCYLKNLVQAVVVAPKASSNWIGLVQLLLKKRGITAPIVRSEFSKIRAFLDEYGTEVVPTLRDLSSGVRGYATSDENPLFIRVEYAGAVGFIPVGPYLLAN